MQRLYSMFPAGGPGVALLLLRASVAAGLLLDEPLRFTSGFARADVVARAVVDAALGIGALTPLATLSAAVLALADATRVGFAASPLEFLTAVNAVALCLLGPGAYSLDARLFGRRVLVLPAKDPRDG